LWIERAKEWTPKSSLPLRIAAGVSERAGKVDELGRIDLILQDSNLTPQEKAALHLEKSALLQRKGRWADALAEFDRAADFQGDLRPSGKRFALLMLAGRTDDATREVEQLLKASNSDSEKTRLHLELSVIYRKQQRWEDALREFDAAVELKPELRGTPDRMELLLLNSKFAEARQELPALEKKLLANWQSQAIVDNLMAYFLAIIGDDLDQALERVDKALQADKESEAYLDTRAFVLYRLGRAAEALPDADAAVAAVERVFGENPKSPDARKNVAVIIYHRSLILEALGKSSKAEQDRDRVRELGFEPDEHLF
jgi:tetratricopeptide (TPR) repeat protein